MVISIERYEKLYIKVFSLLMFIVFFEILFFKGTATVINKDLLIFKLSFAIVFMLFFIYRAIFLFINKFDFEKYFYFFRISEILVFVSFCLFFDNKQWLYILLAFPIIITSIAKGINSSIIMLMYALTLNVFTTYVYKTIVLEIPMQDVKVQIFNFLIYYILIMLLAFLCKKIFSPIELFLENEVSKDIEKNEEKDTGHVIQETYSKLKETNANLEDSNTILAESNAELYTMQLIVRKINSIMNLYDLANCVNDIILGIMGATNVNFILFDKDKIKFKLFATTITSDEKSIVSDNLDRGIMLKIMESQLLSYDNSIHYAKYSFIGIRQIGSVMFVPLVRDTNQLGLIIIEHKLKEYFDDAKLNFMNVVAQQVVIAYEKAELYNKLHEMAVLDGLTGIYNRVYFQKKLTDEIENSKASGGIVSLVILDIDHFKSFNDNYGHLFGDMVLKHIVSLVRSYMRKGDTIARFGGEEFVIIMPNSQVSETYNRIEMIRERLEVAKLVEGNKNFTVTASFGIASYPEVAKNGDELIRAADAALYEAKKAGRNCVKMSDSLNV